HVHVCHVDRSAGRRLGCVEGSAPRRRRGTQGVCTQCVAGFFLAFVLAAAGSALRDLSNARTYLARARISFSENRVLNGIMAVPGTPLVTVAATSLTELPWRHLPSAKFIGSSAALPSAMWQAWQVV